MAEAAHRALVGRRLAAQIDAGERNPDGRFVFRNGVRDALREAELARAGRDLAKAEGREIDTPEHAPNESWRLRETRELFAGRVGVFERGDALTLAPLSTDKSRTLTPGDTIRLARSGPGQRA